MHREADVSIIQKNFDPNFNSEKQMALTNFITYIKCIHFKMKQMLSNNYLQNLAVFQLMCYILNILWVLLLIVRRHLFVPGIEKIQIIISKKNLEESKMSDRDRIENELKKNKSPKRKGK